jgi:putative membrane-bound dehydrogenase-like protein
MLAVWFVVVFVASSSDESLSPAESLAKIQLPPGLTVELAAHEPNVESPVAISFDERGRMFVAEYRDYPTGPKRGEPPLSRIRLLEDKDGDGFFETATIFADRLNFAQGVLAIQGGVIVTAAPDILFLKDTNGDNVADEKRVLFTGFKAGNPQLRVSHPRLGIDNLVYVSNGLSGGEIRHVAAKGPVVPLAKDDFRFDPKTMIGEATTGFGQFGNTFDDWGRRFTCSNRNPVIHSFLPKRVLNRNDQIPIPQGYADVAPFGAESRVYPIARTTTTADSHAGTHTAACGVWIYRGDFCPRLRGDVFACEPTGFLVTRSKLVPKGAGFWAERVEKDRDFLASTDQWFRPVSLADGPDGALYVVDMHRGVIEHPDYLPPGVGKDLRFRAGAEKGRILRIKPSGAKPRPFKPPQTTADMLALLDDPNGWRRDLGQRLLVERNSKEAVSALRQLVQEGNRPTIAPVHALWTLRGLNALTADDLLSATDEKAPLGLWYAAFIAGDKIIPACPDLRERTIKFATSPCRPARLAAVVLVGDFDHPKKAEALGSAVVQMRGFDPWIGRAVISACAGNEGRVFRSAMEKMSAHTQTPEFLDFASQLCAAAVSRGNTELRAVLAALATDTAGTVQGWQVAGLVGLAEGFGRPNPWRTSSLAAFIESPARSLQTESKAVAPLLSIVEKLALEPGALEVALSNDSQTRAAAIRLAGLRPLSRPRLLELIGTRETAEVQGAVFKALERGDPKPVVDRIIAQWPSLPPAVQQAAVDFCFRRRDSQKMFLEAIAAGKASASAIGAERREMMLVFSRDEEMKALAKKLFGASAPNRAALIEQYLPSTKQSGTASKGAEVFKRVCANCHRLKGIGVAVGPELADVRQKAKETLLTEILDPNRTVEPRYASYIAALADGRTVVGLLSSESSTSITLKLPNGVEETLQRSEIEQFRSSGRSLMPEGVEKDVTPAQMADLLEFLCSPN